MANKSCQYFMPLAWPVGSLLPTARMWRFGGMVKPESKCHGLLSVSVMVQRVKSYVRKVLPSDTASG
jgi:hypothetical protein